MTRTEKAIRDYCGHRADWWPSANQVQAMLALAQQEPVACLDCGSPNIGIPATYDSLINSVKTQPEPGPVVCKHEWFSTGAMALGECRCIKCGVWNATTPAAQRPWVELTDAEMQDLWDRYAHMEMMRAIEAKLKEKNFD